MGSVIRVRRKAAVIAATALLLAACSGGGGGGGGGGEEPGSEPAAEGEEASAELVVGTTEPVSTVDPAKCNELSCATLLRNTGNTLFAYPPGEAEPQAELLEQEPEEEPSGVTFTMTLTEDVTFHDGSELTSEDVKFSLERARDIDHPQGAGHLLAGIESIGTPDPLTVEISLTEPDTDFEAKLTHPVATIVPSDGPYEAPEEPLEDPAADEADEYINGEELVASGAYRLEEFSEQSVSYVPFDEYWGSPPSNEGVTQQVFDDGEQLAEALKAGDVDIAFRGLSPEQESELDGSDGIEAVDSGATIAHYLVFNTERDPFTEADARQAVAAALERDRIVEEALGGDAEPLYSLVPRSVTESPPAFEELYTDAEPDEFVDESVSFELHHPEGARNEQEVAQAVADSLSETELLDVTTASSDEDQFRSEAWPGESGQYPAFLLSWPPHYLEAGNYLDTFLDSEDGMLRTYSNDDIDRLLEEARTVEEPDDPQRQEALSTVEEINAEEAAIIPLVEVPQSMYVDAELNGTEDALDEALLLRFWGMWKN